MMFSSTFRILSKILFFGLWIYFLFSFSQESNCYADTLDLSNAVIVVHEGERPAGYIIILLDKEISQAAGCDHGIAAQSILLGAREKGLAGCMHGSVNREAVMEAFGIPSRYEILLVISLGKPKEEVVLETVGPDGSINYWRDENSVHHVPKRPLDEIIIG